MNATIDRINTLAIESTQTALDTASLIQRQNAALIQSWFSTLETNQQTGRELVLKSMKQAQEAQSLWLQLAQENVNVTTETVARAAGSQLREAAEQVKNGSKKAEAGAK